MANSISKTDAILSKTPYEVLGLSVSAIGYDVGYPAGNIHGKTNMWAKYKPQKVSPDTPQAITDEQRAAANYGLSCSMGLEGVAYANAIQLLDATWMYEAPGTNDFKRLTDWMGYDHTSIDPICAAEDKSVSDSGVRTLEIDGQPMQIRPTGNMTIADFPYLQDKYLCCVFYGTDKTSGAQSVIAHFTGTVTLGNGGLQISHPISGTVDQKNISLNFTAKYKDIKYLLCAADIMQQYVSGTTRPRLYPLPTSQPQTANFTYSNESPVSIEFTQVAATAHRRGGLAISNYQLMETDGSGMSFNAKNGFVLYATVKSTTGKPVTIHRTNLLFCTLQTLSTDAGNSTEISLVATKMYTLTSGELSDAVESVIIPVDGITVVFDVSDLPYKRTNTTTGTALRTSCFLNFTMTYNTGSTYYSIPATNSFLRIKDGTDTDDGGFIPAT